MKALVYNGPGKISFEEKIKPTIIAQTDAIVKILKTTICGTDLHILKGDLKSVLPGRILGHEGFGVIETLGSQVSNFKIGDHVIISCVSSCGKCFQCKRGMFSHCENGGGWVLGNSIDGTQAEYVRVLFADNSLYLAPPAVDTDSLVMLSDILPTGFECGVLNGKIKPGDTVAIIGSGPIGLAVLLTAQFYSPSQIIMVDINEHRLEIAKKMGATSILNSQKFNITSEIMNLTAQKGVDVAIEAIGLPESFEMCQAIISAGGHIANIGVHGKPVQLNLDKLWDRNITITTRLVDTSTTPLLIKTVVAQKIKPQNLITHHFKLTDGVKAYEVFSHASEEKALKIILTND